MSRDAAAGDDGGRRRADAGHPSRTSRWTTTRWSARAGIAPARRSRVMREAALDPGARGARTQTNADSRECPGRLPMMPRRSSNRAEHLAARRLIPAVRSRCGADRSVSQRNAEVAAAEARASQRAQAEVSRASVSLGADGDSRSPVDGVVDRQRMSTSAMTVAAVQSRARSLPRRDRPSGRCRCWPSVDESDVGAVRSGETRELRRRGRIQIEPRSKGTGSQRGSSAASP